MSYAQNPSWRYPWLITIPIQVASAILYAKQLTRVLDTQMISNLRSPKPKTIDDSEEMLGPKMKASLKNKPVQEVTIGGIVAPNYKPEKHMFDRFTNSQFYPLVMRKWSYTWSWWGYIFGSFPLKKRCGKCWKHIISHTTQRKNQSPGVIMIWHQPKQITFLHKKILQTTIQNPGDPIIQHKTSPSREKCLRRTDRLPLLFVKLLLEKSVRKVRGWVVFFGCFSRPNK